MADEPSIIDSLVVFFEQPEVKFGLQVAGFLGSAYQSYQLSQIKDDLEKIKKILSNIGKIVAHEIAVNEVENELSVLRLASLHLTEADATAADGANATDGYKKSQQYAEQAASGFLQENIKVGCTSHFLAAASIDLRCCKALSADPLYAERYKNRTEVYSMYASSLVEPVRQSVAKRIEAKVIAIPQGGFPPEFDYKAVYRIDGKTLRSGPLGILEYLKNKRLWEIDSLAAPAVRPLMMAPISWRAARDGVEPNYGTAFEKCIVAVQPEDGPAPWALVLNGRRIHFAVGATIRLFSHVFCSLPADVYHKIPSAADIPQGAEVVYAPEKPHAFVLVNHAFPGWILPFDAPAALTANASFGTMINGVDYNARSVYGHMHAYPYP